MNLPVSPFVAPYKVSLSIDLDNRADDQRRINAEFWCCRETSGKWFRSVDKRLGEVKFWFDDLHEATLFRLSH